MPDNVNIFRMLAYLRLMDRALGKAAETTNKVTFSTQRFTEAFKTAEKRRYHSAQRGINMMKAMEVKGAEIETSQGTMRFTNAWRKQNTGSRRAAQKRYTTQEVLNNYLNPDPSNPNPSVLPSWGTMFGISGRFAGLQTTLQNAKRNAQIKIGSFLGEKSGALKDKSDALKMATLARMSVPYKDSDWRGKLTHVGAGMYNIGSSGLNLSKGAMEIASLPFKTIKGISAGASKGIASALSGLAKIPGGNFALSALLDVVMQLATAINPFKDLLSALVDIFGVFGDILGAAFAPLIEKLFAVFLSEKSLKVIEGLAMAFAGVVDVLINSGLIEVMAEIGGIFVRLFAQVITALTPIILSLMPVFIPILKAFAYVIWLVANVVIVCVMAIGVIANIFIGIVRGIIHIANFFGAGIDLSPFKYVDMTKMKFIPLPDFSTPTALASGGVVTKATNTIIGEAGPEAVVPLDKAGQFGLGSDMESKGYLRDINANILLLIQEIRRKERIF